MRLLAGVHPDRALDLAEHLAVHGGLPRINGPALVEQVAASGLTGRGGAAFPLVRKLEAVARGRRRPVVVVNAAESEPASSKDDTLLRLAPHVVLDGAQAAAQALGTREVFVWVHRGATAARRVLDEAIAERTTAGSRMRIGVVDGPDRYVAGDASAAVRRISGGPSLPTASPYRTAERGVRGRPTLVANAETYGHLALIARHGAPWFRTAGLPEEPGTLLATVRGAGTQPVVLEVEVGTPVRTALRLAGCGEPVAGLLVGGYGGTWLHGSKIPAALLSRGALAALGADLGVGLLLVLPEGACPLAETERLLHWLASESTGQCGPCVNGLPELARRFGDVVEHGRRADEAAAVRVGGLVTGRGACSSPDGAARLAATALREFADHVRLHERRGRCPDTAAQPVAPLPQRQPVAVAESWR